jgi:RES domain
MAATASPGDGLARDLVDRDPLVGNDAGGRWHPANSFEALYTSLEADGSLAEMYYHLSRAPVFASSHMRLHRLRVQTKKLVASGHEEPHPIRHRRK